ncbi:hypothetical protein Y032_0009g831 [Ancylostoma ceylanicum]|uniref:Uncharacterized protein n=1 Tax=Ancylostoma ceylanicum TaxID=53326 RepID=A0A016VJP6_9BILA|nr:hypothetical protein Y032_0009g831 [Ancylostoma ceylanicum]
MVTQVSAEADDECSALVMDQEIRNKITTRHQRISKDTKYDCELEQMAKAMMTIASYDLPTRFGWIMVEGTGKDIDEKLGDAFVQLQQKLEKAGNQPKRYGCFFEEDWAVLNCVYDAKLVLSTC